MHWGVSYLKEYLKFFVNSPMCFPRMRREDKNTLGPAVNATFVLVVGELDIKILQLIDLKTAMNLLFVGAFHLCKICRLILYKIWYFRLNDLNYFTDMSTRWAVEVKVAWIFLYQDTFLSLSSHPANFTGMLHKKDIKMKPECGWTVWTSLPASAQCREIHQTTQSQITRV